LKGFEIIMLKINLIHNRRVYPAVWYTHCLLNRPVKTIIYKRFPLKSRRSINIFVKIMAMLHDYVLCYENEYGIKYGTFTYYKQL
jgi:hypothetical protein